MTTTLVVTGAAGFIGRHVVARVLARGATVVGIDRRSWAPATGEHALTGDLAAPTDPVLDALRDADGLIHLAGRPGVRDEVPDADRRRHRDNVVAAATVLAAVPLGVPTVVASSSSVYGGSLDRRPSRETDRLLPRGGYARSKAEMEARCAERATRGGHVGVVRPFTVAGPGQRPDMALHRWIRAARAGEPLLLLGSPNRRRDITDVHDVAEGIVRMLEREVTSTVNLGTGVSHSLHELVAVVAEVLDVPVATTVASAHPAEATTTRADVRRCEELLGFVPRTDLRRLVRQQAAASQTLVEAA